MTPLLLNHTLQRAHDHHSQPVASHGCPRVGQRQIGLDTVDKKLKSSSPAVFEQ